MQLDRFAGPDAFLDRVGTFLAAQEAEHNLMLGICSGLRAAPGTYHGPVYFAAVTDGPRVVLAALRTPPHYLVISEVEDAAALELLADDVAREPPPGVHGPREHAGRLADLVARRAGLTYRLTMAERIFRLTRVRPPRAASGFLRRATLDDRELLIEWLADFSRDALHQDDVSDVPAIVDRWLGEIGRTLWVWDDDGAVSLTGASGATPRGIRVGPVYTPPPLRGRGYASACVAAVSQAQLDAGRAFCFLFTDIANPTSNHIYQAIGYEPVRDVEVYRFDAPPGT